MMRVPATLPLAALLYLVLAAARSQAAVVALYTPVFYPSGALQIQTYLHKPSKVGRA